MKTHLEVSLFHHKFGHPAPDSPRTPKEIWITSRKDLIREETEELCDAIDSGNLIKIAREAVDLIYVAMGVLVAYGLPARRCWNAVHRANMTKAPAPPGQKPTKPEGWVSPDAEIEAVVCQAILFGKERIDADKEPK